MSLSIGIVGLPNVGKTTLFNALVKSHQAKVADYPFTTIEPNVGIVEVPDERLAKLGVNLKLKKIIPATIKFVDIAGLVKNAHEGEGLGNQFLSHIREVDAILHVIDAFSKKNSEAEQDIEIINLELELAEIQKPTLDVYNVLEKELGKAQDHENAISLCAKMEEELIDLPADEAQKYLQSYDLKESGLDRLIKASYKLLNLITFYTLKLTDGQVQAWPILKGTLAPEAASKIHTDFERGFIAAEVVKYDDFVACDGWAGAKEKGLVKTQGKDYVVADGDIILFRFNV